MTPDTDYDVGLIGLGLLGQALAERLLAAEISVCGFDLAAAARERLEVTGGSALSTAMDVAKQSDVLMLCLPNTEIVEDVLSALQPLLRPNQHVIDTTTGDPDRTVALAARLQSIDVALVDATVLGSSEVTRQGEAVLMVGGTTDAVATCGWILSAIAPSRHHVGPAGSGQQMKLVANLVLGLNRAALAEGLHFARKLGLELNSVLTILQSGAAASRVMDSKGRRMIEADFTPQARLSQHLKDVRLILGQATAVETELPFSELHRQMLERVEDAGDGLLDNSAIIRAW